MARLRNHPGYWLRDDAAAAFDAYERDHGVISVNSAGRTVSEQQELINRWNRGGASNRPPYLYMPAMPAYTSNHVANGGIAVDTSHWNEFRQHARNYGFAHPYPVSDPVHFEYVGGGTAASSDGWSALAKQRFLNTLGLSIAADGDFGPASTAATTQFQTWAGIASDGHFGPATQAQATLVERGGKYVSRSVIEIQNRLTALGYWDSRWARDGVWGNQTSLATMRFQRSQGLTADGQWGELTDGRAFGVARPAQTPAAPAGRVVTLAQIGITQTWPERLVAPGSRTDVAVHWDGGRTPVTEADEIELLRTYHQYHLNQGYGGIGYNQAVGPVTGNRYRLRGFGVLGAAVGDYNTPVISVLLIGGPGNLTEKGKRALQEVYAEANAYTGKTLGQKGHRDFNDTTCPGDAIYAWIRSGEMGRLPANQTTTKEEEDEMKPRQIHYKEADGKIIRALIVPGTGYFVKWTEGSGSTYANNIARLFETSSSVEVTKSLFDVFQREAEAMRPRDSISIETAAA